MEAGATPTRGSDSSGCGRALRSREVLQVIQGRGYRIAGRKGPVRTHVHTRAHMRIHAHYLFHKDKTLASLKL